MVKDHCIRSYNTIQRLSSHRARDVQPTVDLSSDQDYSHESKPVDQVGRPFTLNHDSNQTSLIIVFSSKLSMKFSYEILEVMKG